MFGSPMASTSKAKGGRFMEPPTRIHIEPGVQPLLSIGEFRFQTALRNQQYDESSKC